MILKHICEVCGCEEVLDSDEAFELGWDYPLEWGNLKCFLHEHVLTARLKKLCGGH